MVCLSFLVERTGGQQADFIVPPATKTPTEQAVAAAETALLVAENTCDAKGMSTWTSDDFWHVALTSRATPKTLYLKECDERGRGASTVKEIQLRVTPTIAIVRGYWIGHGRRGRGEVGKLEVVYIRVWTRTPRGWRASLYQETGGPPEE
jgi:hypothetical protein